MRSEFRNEPLTDFSKEENAQAMRDAIQKVKEQLGREYPLVIGGERINTGNLLESYNPANRTEVVGRFHKATKELANRAVEEASKAFQNLEERLRQPIAQPCCFVSPRSCANASTSFLHG